MAPIAYSIAAVNFSPPKSVAYGESGGSFLTEPNATEKPASIAGHPN